VKREGNRYTVLTAWHVVSGQRPGEELDIYTPDGQRHLVEQGSVKRLGDVDMAVLTFTSPSSCEVARIGDVKSVSSGSSIYVAGFPLPTSAVPSRLWRFLDGKVIANATVAIPNGYQLLYSNPTLPGMSGGAVMNAQGQLVGIHGQGETDRKMTEQQGVAVKNWHQPSCANWLL
jgi:S1-C subfamily serine protease